MSDGKQLEYEEEEQSVNQQRIPRDDGTELPIKEGAVFGALAVVVTYLAHFFLTVVASAQMTPVVNTTGDTPVATDLVASWTAAGWSYLATFGVGFKASGEAIALGDIPNNPAALANSPASLANSPASLANSPFFLSGAVLFAVTVGAVTAAGYGIARYTDADGPAEAAKAGITVVPPYLAFGVITALLMTATFSDYATVFSILESVPLLQTDQFINVQEQTASSNITVKPSTGDAVLFAGIVFPAIFAVVGSLITQGEEVIDAAVAKVEELT
ncbi:hypothetical protein [Natrinema sp. 74]|uniref:hypothetical protein n=1 Tax=Natrinema sp. 74 TaxID=3384159 RepID=UPI0038D44114